MGKIQNKFTQPFLTSIFMKSTKINDNISNHCGNYYYIKEILILSLSLFFSMEYPIPFYPVNWYYTVKSTYWGDLLLRSPVGFVFAAVHYIKTRVKLQKLIGTKWGHVWYFILYNVPAERFPYWKISAWTKICPL